jgi:hypothetical protein
LIAKLSASVAMRIYDIAYKCDNDFIAQR